MTRTIRYFFLLSVFLMLAGGCAYGDGGNGAYVSDSEETLARQAAEEETEAAAREAAEVEQEFMDLLQDDYMLMDKNDNEERLILKSLTTGRQYRFAYGLSTKFLNKWGSSTSQTNFTRGSIVKLGGVSDNQLSSISLSKDAWVIDRLKNFSYNIGKETFKVGDTKSRLRPDVSVFSGDGVIGMNEVSRDDRLRVVGIGKNVLSITVETGHGYISLQNTSFFNDSLVSIGTRIHAMLNGDTTVSVPEGKYRITVAKDGYGGSTKVKVKKDETVYVDLDTLKGEGPKKCKLHLVANVGGVKAFLDGERIKINRNVPVVYGQHTLRVEVKGYIPWEKELMVNSPRARISLDPAEDAEKSAAYEEPEKETAGSATNAANSQNSSTNSTTSGSGGTTGNTGQGSTNGSLSNGSTTNNATNSTTNSTGNTTNNTGTAEGSTGGTGRNANTVTNSNLNNNTINNSNSTMAGGNNYGAGSTNTGSDYGAGEGANSRQAELDYLDTLSNMINQLTGD